MLTNDKRYQVFVSSTFEDLQEERKEVMNALLELDCIPAGMELFPASNEDQWSLIKRVIDSSDYYLLIIGGRYGSIDPITQISYTEMEFQYALETNKPIISFLHKAPETIPSGKTEQSNEGRQKLEKFKEKVKQKLVRFWTSPAELGSVVSRSMIQLIKNFPAEGWVRANSNTDPAAKKEIDKLQREIERLKSIIANKEKPIHIENDENLAQGESCYEIELSYECMEMSGEFSSKFSKSWDDIFRVISPSLSRRANKHTIKTELENWLRIQLRNQEGMELDSVSIDATSFETILAQFYSLGYLMYNKQDRYFELTDFGERKMYSLLAVYKK